MSGNRTGETHRRPGQADRVTGVSYAATQPHFASSAQVTSGASTVTRSYAADAAGNTVSRPGPTGAQQTLAWDDEGHLGTVTAGSTVVQENWYDAQS